MDAHSAQRYSALTSGEHAATLTEALGFSLETVQDAYCDATGDCDTDGDPDDTDVLSALYVCQPPDNSTSGTVSQLTSAGTTAAPRMRFKRQTSDAVSDTSTATTALGSTGTGCGSSVPGSPKIQLICACSGSPDYEENCLNPDSNHIAVCNIPCTNDCGEFQRK